MPSNEVTPRPFSCDYREARNTFIATCQEYGIDTTSFVHPLLGPNDETLSTDVAEMGPAESSKLLIVNSGIHGAEGFCGSAAIVHWLLSGIPLNIAQNPQMDMRIVLIHALNPYGFAWLSRVNEDNIDINRNFVSNFEAVPENTVYREVHPYLLPDLWNRSSENEIIDYLKQRAERTGLMKMQSEVCRGQYEFSDGVFFGGYRPSWSRKTFTEIVERNVKSAESILMLDFHTGLGPFGIPELISATSPEKFQSHFADRVTFAGYGNAVGPMLTGTLGQGLRALSTASTTVSLTVEFGTRDVPHVLHSLIADNWLINRGGGQTDSSHPIKARVKDSFYPQQVEWENMVLDGATRVFRDAVKALENF